MRLKALVVLAAAATVALPATNSEAQKRVRWKLQSTWGAQVPVLGTSGVAFSKNIDTITDGKFKVKFDEPGALVPALECFDAASKGSVDACWTTPGYHAGKFGRPFHTLPRFLLVLVSVNSMLGKSTVTATSCVTNFTSHYGVIAFDMLLHRPETSGWFKNGNQGALKL